MAMDDNGTGRNYRRKRFISPMHAIQRLRERFALPDHLTLMKDRDLGHWLDEQVDKAIRHGYFERLEDDRGKFTLVKFGEIVADAAYAVVRTEDHGSRTANKRFKEVVVTVLNAKMVHDNRQKIWKQQVMNPAFASLANFDLSDAKPVGPECFGGEDLPHAPSAASLAEPQPPVDEAGEPVDVISHRVTYEPILITYCFGEDSAIVCEEFNKPADVQQRIGELIDRGITVKAWRPIPFERKTEITF